jgi:N-acetylneuraminic acid mutarotase
MVAPRAMALGLVVFLISGCSEDSAPAENGGAGAGGAASGGTSGGGAGGTGTGTAVERRLEPLPAVRQEHAVVALAGEIYVVGGFTPTVAASVLAYKPTANGWRGVADFPAFLHHANAAAVNGKLYVAGFYLNGGFNSADARTFEYDPQRNGWTEKSPMPAQAPRAAACVAALDQKIYLFGGARLGTVSDAVVYDAASDTWQALPALPEPREHCVAGTIDGKIYIASGRSAGIGGFQANTWAYDPALQRYERRAPIPTPRGGTAGAVLDGKLFVFGGEGNAADASGVFPDVEAYDPVSDSWQTLPDMLVPRHGFGAAMLEGRIYLPGGATRQAFGAVNDHSSFGFE